ncbi:MAG: efflux RND transporter periplasmic adaptor subunit, partial [Candidatus Krumholzibacteriia bacterium]
ALLPPEAIFFEARVHAADAPRIRIGQPAQIATAGQPPRAGAVRRVLPVVGEGDQTTLVWLEPATSDAAPELDRFGTATIRVGAPRPAPAVPDSAVVQDDLTGETRIALIGPDGRAGWRAVTLGLAAGGWYELMPPAPPVGALVITEGQRGLADSTLVKVLR